MKWRGNPTDTIWRFEFKPQDCWIGIYWRRDGGLLDIWICFVPMLPLHLAAVVMP